MTIKQVKQLRPGDRVFWNDPDDGICSRYYNIRSIEFISEDEDAVCICDKDDSVLECYIRELT